MAVVSDASNLLACRQIISACNQAYGWQLDAFTYEYYVHALTPLITAVPPERQSMVVLHYHLDHRMVAALRDAHHPAHHETWVKWSQQVLGVLRRAGIDWSRDGSLELDDLAQIARGDLAQALPSYRYQSRFLSWAYSVVVRSAHRYVRMSRAQRRSAPSVSLDLLTTTRSGEALAVSHEETTYARLLATRVQAVLAAHADQRLLPIFRLWAVEERTSAEIGSLVNLHESRVRALLKLARTVLRNDPVIRQWYATGDEQQAAS
ncbi:MAG: sigma-70 family RNA polymerase sigma factor [Chloroflexia bacterium]|nr:sigma-70 family RNA polymerase sigma factor [Chloroflexia bacterium]